jgi:chromosome segregation protein
VPDQRLRKLELTGFKTFARRTELLLPGGLTGIVGPNGSGKSNLADALRWALGEQTLQHIRSKKTEDVIFAGGANRAPLGTAEVTLTLDNTSGWIPLDFSEVTLTRRAYRSGENEYFINNARVRLRDVIELRNRAGFGQSSYSVIGQGLVDAVLSQRPDERRALFEEAAGIRHYQAKRDQTLDQLAAAEQNLVRVQDILAEIEPRLESLRRQSERAQQHAQLSEELRTLQIRWYAARRRHMQRQLAEAEALASEAQRELDTAAERSQLLAGRISSIESEKLAHEQRLAELNRSALELQRQREQLLGHKSLAEDKLQFIRQQSQDAERELSQIAQSREALGKQLARIDADLAELRLAEDTLTAQMRGAEERAKAQADTLQAAEEQLRQAREALTSAGSLRTQAELEIADLTRRRADLEQQAHQHAEDLKRKEGLRQALNEKHAALQAELQRLRGDDERLSGQTEEARLAAIAAAAALNEQQAKLADLRRMHSELATRLSLLEELQTNLEGLGEGTRMLIRERRPGVLGSVTERLKVEPGYERAIAAALGHKLDAVLVASQGAALAILANGSVAEATLLVHNGAAPDTEPAPPVEGIRTASSVVREPEPSIEWLLAGTVITADLEQALEAKRRGWRAVTIDGDVVDLDGTISRRGMTAGEAVLKRQETIAHVRDRLSTSTAAVEAAEKECDRLASQAAELEAQLARLEQEARQHALLRQQKAAEIRDFGQQIDAAQAQVDWLSNLAQQAGEQANAVELRRLALVAELDQGAARLTQLRAELQASEEQLAAAQEAARRESERSAQIRLDLGVTRQELQHLQSQRGDLQQQVSSIERQLELRQRRAGEQAGIAARLQAEIDSAAAGLAGVEAQLRERELALPPLREQVAALAEQGRTLREQEAATHEQQSELDKRCYRLSFDQQRKREELESLASSLMDDLQLTLDVLPSPEPELPEPSKREIDSLKARLAAIGPINPGALEEFREVAQRHDFLTSQKADLAGAADRLRTVISELEELTRRQFLETFGQVATEFPRFFDLMFEGGKVDMFLTDPDNVHTTGVEIMAQPPGKRLQALPLLSGGERALVASALLFAILSVRPVPFCLLDEVDAALDEANVKRFCQALRSLAEGTQFIVITHNRETMAVADALYGVSMSQDGVSRLVSLRLPREEGRPETDERLGEALQMAG